MKAAIILLGLTVLGATVYVNANAVCNPDAQGKPDCNGVAFNADVKVRNNWDPTCYFQCDGNNECPCVPCGIGKGFDPITNDCIEWAFWKWLEVCPTPTSRK